MNLLADEGVDRGIVLRLREAGHDVVWIAELSPSVSDETVLTDANDRDALLLTSDKDFGELVFRLGRIHEGVVLLRLFNVPAAMRADLVVAVLRDHAAELPGAFSVISPGRVRIRRIL